MEHVVVTLPKPTRAFTDRFVDSLKPGAKRLELPDPGCPNLYLVIQPSGAKSWAWRARHPITGKPVKRTFGSLKTYGLADAHEWARAQTKARDLGVDLDEADRLAAEAKAIADKLDAERSGKTLSWFWKNHYQKRHIERLDDRYESKRMYERYLEPVLGEKALHLIDHDDLAGIIAKLHSHAPVTANRMVTMLKTLWKRAMSEFRTETGLRINPAEHLVKPHRERSRERTLDRRELGYLLLAIEDIGAADDYKGVYARALKLIAYTGVRLQEALKATWSEFDLKEGIWEIGGDRTKNGKPLVLPLAVPTVEWLKGIKPDKAPKDYMVFGIKGSPKSPLGGTSKPQAHIFNATKLAAERDGLPIESWSAHDIRRTLSTELAGISDDALNPMVPPHVIEAVLNHVSGAARLGVAGVYNRYSYRKEKKEALRIWADHLAGIHTDARGQPA